MDDQRSAGREEGSMRRQRAWNPSRHVSLDTSFQLSARGDQVLKVCDAAAKTPRRRPFAQKLTLARSWALAHGAARWAEEEAELLRVPRRFWRESFEARASDS